MKLGTCILCVWDTTSSKRNFEFRPPAPRGATPNLVRWEEMTHLPRPGCLSTPAPTFIEYFNFQNRAKWRRSSVQASCGSACKAANVYTHHYHLVLPSPKAGTHFTVPRRVGGRVNLGECRPSHLGTAPRDSACKLLSSTPTTTT